MKQAILLFGILVIVAVVILPAFIVRGLYPGAGGITNPAKPARGEEVYVRVFLHENGRITEMPLEEYVNGVVAAEMPAGFEPEALKAQAVAARTFAVKNMAAFGGSGLAEHPGADISTDHRSGQAWLSEEQLKERWGAAYPKYREKITRAVADTAGMIAVYNGEPIHAVFHSTSGARTASAKEVWGSDYPYLVSVDCPWDQNAPRYQDTKEFALADIETILGAGSGVVTALKTGSSGAVAVLNRTDSGRVDKMRIGSSVLSGVEIRDKMGLRSTNFTFSVQGDKLVVKTIGYGHGVGLCQYGANGMAKEGRDFRQILTHYYTGVSLRNIFGS